MKEDMQERPKDEFKTFYFNAERKCTAEGREGPGM
jgi:hypothetical protein